MRYGHGFVLCMQVNDKGRKMGAADAEEYYDDYAYEDYDEEEELENYYFSSAAGGPGEILQFP